MKLFFAPRSPFATKVRIVVHELGLEGSVEMAPTDPWTDETLRTSNPLGKVPTLLLDSGEALFDSRVICEFLDRHRDGGLFPSPERGRWAVLRRQALADGVAEAVIRRHVERLGPPSDRSEKLALRQEAALTAGLDALERETAAMGQGVTIGEIAATAALLYLTFRAPDVEWRRGRPGLGAWYDIFSGRASVQAVRSAYEPAA